MVIYSIDFPGLGWRVVQEMLYTHRPFSVARRHNVVFPEPEGPDTTSNVPNGCFMAVIRCSEPVP